MSPITEVEGRRITLRNLDKVIHPATGTTKGELLHYLASTADALLGHLRGRPLAFLRYPDGPDGQKFFTKNPPPGTPSWVTTAEVTRHKGETARQVLIQDLPSLMWAANLVVELHTPMWRIDQGVGSADRLVLDLDPGPPATIVDCRVVAVWLRERLRADGLTAYAKTSGSKGLHLLVPLEPTPSRQATAYARRLALEAANAMPDLVIRKMTRSLRPGKVYVDFSQNAAAKTTAAPYTPRALPEPAVSAPVTWEEVEECGDPSALTFLIDDIPARLDRHGDLLAPLLDPAQARPLPTGSGGGGDDGGDADEEEAADEGEADDEDAADDESAADDDSAAER
ncbi:non-homologous end-joining DNA ligase [Streptomyces malaysiensis subsp. malaysiensis]|uniref:Non-homologous end-joining DNA ligase n=1 Tax=Streptomyces malaysiensis TaxID=92644 RepID=A0ABX6WAE7_STRMQ|nr:MULTISPECIES: non-homologous end-joining DNA ligase [Streptomyces]QPI58096.1 non-homologous end-joining DNA ligase [Streptomyces solisilvae]UHH19674.1 non-homologous end-joining DNA ligase [Streptomyces sp. HNM0561]